MTIKDVREKIMLRFNTFSSGKGEWNDGYTSGILYAVGIIDDLIKSEEKIVKIDSGISKSKLAHPSYKKY
jgi:hypothetical protein